MRTLTPREAEVVELIAFGLSQKEVAANLCISPATVDVTLKNAKLKLGVQKSSEISAWYFISRYKISVDLSPVKRAMISLSFLATISVSMLFGFSPERFFRSMRGTGAQMSRTIGRVRRNESVFTYQFA